ncbi:short-chain dehydrogenase/reductase SDR [Ammonifex degensii KC4]|uniref:Enoyl-[acyl-carrier-protein] reductase [NADH] n=1 Tax=Ammonifex degensii (strain DSM 10501 / KC4) TaxID=429009 RepID=C9RCR3_AMMDK|nr:enoyl-ACP reductase [Ammonifex degensii]ACX52040.1 short-chain dehydrogenase/reductase SDR [Ammonifex degensii KC4]
MGLVTGKRALVLGVANKHSIAWGIAQVLHREGASLWLNYQNERFYKNVAELAAELDPNIPLSECDVTKPEQVENLFAEIEKRWGKLDILVHSLAFAPREALEGEFYKTTLEQWNIAMEVSAYSLVLCARHAKPLLEKEGGSIITLTYLGSQRAVKNYNVMGVAKAALEAAVRYLAADLGPFNIRVNAISAGPIKTVAARGVAGFSSILKVVEEKAPLRRNVTQEEVGKVALFLASDLASAVTGEVIFVDCGFHAVGV